MRVKRSDHLNSPASGLLHKQPTVLEEAEIGPPPLMVPLFFSGMLLTSSTLIHLPEASVAMVTYLVSGGMQQLGSVTEG